MRVVILGGRGFVGAALAGQLERLGVDTVRLNRPAFDLTDTATWDSLPACDCVVHAAGGHAATTWDTFRVNLLPVQALAERCNRLGIGKFIYLSTGRVYGYGPEPAHPGMECRPVGDYPVSKYLAEKVLAEHFDGQFSTARLYYPYGAGQQPPRVLPRLALQVARNEIVTCAEGGGPRLTLSHVDDVARVLARDFVMADTPPPVANIASDTSITIAEIVTLLAAHFECEPRLATRGEPLDEFSLPYAGYDWRPFRVQDIVPEALR